MKAIDTVALFIQNPHHTDLRNHALSGVYRGLRSIDVTGDYRIFFRELSGGTYEFVELVDIGTHSQLYG